MKLEGILVFKREHNTESLNSYEVREINFFNNTCRIYLQDKTLGFPYSDGYSKVKDVTLYGYKNAKEFYNEMKRRGYISDKDFISTEEQTKSELEGFINLAIDRHKNHRKYYDIVQHISEYYNVAEAEAADMINKRIRINDNKTCTGILNVFDLNDKIIGRIDRVVSNNLYYIMVINDTDEMYLKTSLNDLKLIAVEKGYKF